MTYAGSESSLGLTMTTDPNTPAKNFDAIQYSWGFSLTNYAEFGFWFSNDAPDPAHGGGTWRVDCGSIKGLLTPAEQLAFNCYQDSTGPFFMLENVSGNSNKIRVAHSIIASGVFLRGIYDHTGVGKANCPGAIGQYTLHVYQAGSPPREVSGSPVRVCDGSNTPDWPAYIHIGNNISNSSFNGTYHFHWSNVQYRNDGGSIQP